MESILLDLIQTLPDELRTGLLVAIAVLAIAALCLRLIRSVSHPETPFQQAARYLMLIVVAVAALCVMALLLGVTAVHLIDAFR